MKNVLFSTHSGGQIGVACILLVTATSKQTRSGHQNEMKYVLFSPHSGGQIGVSNTFFVSAKQ
jgi:hypothetical protein